ncbi:MAG TPA: hypothetical protein DEO84_04055 [candidate division Zixibacteria bacterium]|nr:hypothetical protein [candidate division Zixibacteria bacterium]HBZ00477.1 hypothetical protein [candidate division Zixibacteria bacterium]
MYVRGGSNPPSGIVFGGKNQMKSVICKDISYLGAKAKLGINGVSNLTMISVQANFNSCN